MLNLCDFIQFFFLFFATNHHLKLSAICHSNDEEII